MKFKIIYGYGEKSYQVINQDELPKAYWLFDNPEKQGIFDNGVPIKGKHIVTIEPAYEAEVGAEDVFHAEMRRLDKKAEPIMKQAVKQARNELQATNSKNLHGRIKS